MSCFLTYEISFDGKSIAKIKITIEQICKSTIHPCRIKSHFSSIFRRTKDFTTNTTKYFSRVIESRKVKLSIPPHRPRDIVDCITCYICHRSSPLPWIIPAFCRAANLSKFCAAIHPSGQPNSVAIAATYHKTSPSSFAIAFCLSLVTTPSSSRRIFLTLFAISPASPTSPKVA